ncbi:MAG: PstS family phosphate ABC transporter substrate-binding protein [Rikenellaceae bacterium]
MSKGFHRILLAALVCAALSALTLSAERGSTHKSISQTSTILLDNPPSDISASEEGDNLELSSEKEKEKSERKILREAKKRERKARRAQRRSLEGEIQLSGSFALYPMVVKWASEFREIYPRVKVDISSGGAGKGITDALSSIVDMGMISRELNEAEEEKGALAIAVARDAVVATVNSRNPHIIEIKTRGLKPSVARKLWSIGSISSWGEILGSSSTDAVHLYTRSDACGASEKWASWLGVTAEELLGTAVYSDPGMASVTQRDKLSLAYSSIAYAYNIRNGKPHKGILIVPIDTDEDGIVDLDEEFYGTLSELNGAITSGKYPSRELYIVCKGIPSSPCVKAFIEYILTEGQDYASANGYVPLSDEEAEAELRKCGLENF